MPKKQRGDHSRAFKAELVREHLLNGRRAQELCAEYGLHPLLLQRWIQEFIAAGEDAFDRARAGEEFRLRIEIGRLEMALARRRRLLREIRQAQAEEEPLSGPSES
jgi:transposase-like protein